jgi:Domain of unknown function (DUF4440)
MRGLLLGVVCLASTAGCRIEDHTPQGSRLDEVAVTALVTEYARALSARDWPGVRALFWRDGAYSGPMVPRSVGQTVPIDTALHRFAFALDGAEPGSFDVRVLRTDFRQDGDLASVWLTLRRRTPLGDAGPAERDWVEHLVLRRIGGNWRILSVAGSAVPRGSPRDQR